MKTIDAYARRLLSALTGRVKDLEASPPGAAAWGDITGTLSDQTDLQTALDAKAADNAVVKLTGNQTVAGTKTFSSDVVVPDEAYDEAAWNGSMEAPTKNAVRDEMESVKTSDAAKFPTASILRSYLAAPATFNNTTTFANTALSVPVEASGIYEIEMVLHATNPTQDVKLEFGGTATVTNFIGQYQQYDTEGGNTGAGIRVTAIGDDFVGAGDTLNTMIIFRGSVEINGAGTFLLRGAQNVAHASDTQILRGGTLKLTKLN